MADECFRHPRLAALYDALDADRGDLDAHLGMAEQFGARRVVDIGCGTGVFALAAHGIDVVGVDPPRRRSPWPGPNRAASRCAGLGHPGRKS